jgi:hypothetical protein
MELYSIALVGLIKDLDPKDPKIMLIPMCGIFWPDSGIDMEACSWDLTFWD